jgi:hypothetical protein
LGLSAGSPAIEVYALIRGRDVRAAATALCDVLGNLSLNMLPPNTPVEY